MESFLKKTNPLIFLAPLFFFVAVVLGWKFIVHPKVVQWVKSKVPELNSSQPFAEVDFKDLQISLLKLQIQAGDIQVTFKNEFKKFENIKIGRIKVQINPFDLLIGQLNINSITLDQAAWSFPDTAFESHSKSEPQDLPMEKIFKYLPQIPIQKIRIINSDLHVTSRSKKLAFDSHLDSVTLENLKNRLNLIVVRWTQSLRHDSNAPVTFDGSFSLTLTEEQLKINSAVLKNIESEFRLSGKLNQFKYVTKNPVGELSIESTLYCDNLRTFYLSLFPQKMRIPSISGVIQTKGRLSFSKASEINGDFEINTTNLSVDHFKFGKALIKAQIKKNQIHMEEVHIEHPAGLAELSQIEIEQSKPYAFKTTLDVKSFNLQKLFASLGLGSIPADFNLFGKATCHGQFLAPYAIECQTAASLSKINVILDNREKTALVKIKDADISGNLIFNGDDIQFESEIKIGKSNGSAKGVVDFQKGFKIDFQSKDLNLSDIESLAGLDLKGHLNITGSTWGNSERGILETEFTADGAEIEKFVLGRFSTELKYEAGFLFFRRLSGQLGQSNFDANLTFNFLKGTLSGDLNSKNIHGEDIYLALNKKFQLPFELSGSGLARAEFSGPFNFWKLKYDLQASLKQGQIADEGFDQLDLNLNSDGKKINFSNVTLSKVKSRLFVTGVIDTAKAQPEFDLVLKTNQASLEEIDSLSRFLPSTTGLIAINGGVTGPLNAPDVKINFNARQVNLEGFDYLPSQGQIEFDKKYLQLNAQLFGRQIQTQLKWPWKKDDDYFLKFQVRDLNPLILLPLISIPQPNSEFYSRLNLDLDLKGDSRDLDHTRGQIRLADFLLQRGSQIIKLKTPAALIFDSGLKKMDPVDLVGEDSEISIHMLDAQKAEPKLDIKVSLKIRLLQFLIPFVDSINGQLVAEARMSLRSGPLQIFGEGKLSEGSLKLKGFPTAINSIVTPIEFSQTKIFLSDISAQLGNSELDGNGQIEIKGAKNIVVQLQAQTDSLEITFPEKVTTMGKVDLSFFGNWLPYTLKIDYRVNRGLIEKDFGQDSGGPVTLRGSQFLPAKQVESQTPSLLLDVTVDLSQGVVVKNKLLEGTALGNLQIKGSPENPLLVGKIDIKPGSKIIFKDKPFEVQTANIKFLPSPEINPDLYISALARVSDYDINLLVQGPAKNPTIEATSQPPLSKSDIFSLLALGMTSTKMDQNLSSEAQQQQTGIEVLAAISNGSEFNKKIQQTLGLNVQLATSVDSTRNIAVPKVVVTKKIIKKLNASYSKPLTGDQNQEVKLQYLFNPHWSGILNYQNKETNQLEGSPQTQNQNEKGILGGDVEYKKEFKW